MGQPLSTYLLQAASAGDLPTLQQALDQGANVNFAEKDSQWTALHYAAWGGHERAARELLVRDASVNARDADQRTPLHLAVLGGHDGTVQALCDHGADVSAADADGQTPLHKAAVQDQLLLVQELVARGARLDAQLQDGSTPAHLAAWKGHAQLLAYLLASGADVTARTAAGETPLHEAARTGQDACCRALLANGASRAALDNQERTPADVALMADFVSTAGIVRPQPGEMEASIERRQAGSMEASAAAQPSAPVWDDGAPITYPVIHLPAESAPAPQAASARTQLAQSSAQGRSAADWEPQPEDDDWEGVPNVTVVPSRGTQLIEGMGQEGSTGSTDPFWMVPEPVRWAAATVGGILGSVNPFRRQAEQQHAQAEAVAPDPQSNRSEARAQSEEETLVAREAEVARLSEPRTRDRLTAAQLSRLQQQEAEIAELRARLGKDQEVASLPAAAHPQTAQAAIPPMEAPTPSRTDVAAGPPATCREASREELYRATSGFSRSRVVSEDESATVFRATLDGAGVTVVVPKQAGEVPWHIVQGAAARLGDASSRSRVPVQAVCRDGTLVLGVAAAGTVEGALQGRAAAGSAAPARLDWPARLAVATRAAEGLLSLHAASPPIRHAAVQPANVLLTSALEAHLLPPALTSIIFGPQAMRGSAYSAPEVRRGGPPSAASDVYSLGMLLMQLLTGSEPSGLPPYIQAAVDEARLPDVLDPCADGISAPSALPIAKLALRCTAFHPEDRPDLAGEAVPVLTAASANSSAVPASAPTSIEAEEPPPHIVCPITQEVLTSPVILADGYTYEESAISEWLRRGNTVSPMTNVPLAHLNPTPNFVIKSAASTWLEQHPGYSGGLAAADLDPQPEAPSAPAAEADSAEDMEIDLPSAPTGEASEAAMRAHMRQAASEVESRGDGQAVPLAG